MVDESLEAATQARILVHGALQSEDAVPDGSDGVIELVDELDHPLAICATDPGGQAVEPEPHAEDPLDCVVVQVAGDPGALFGELGLLGGGLVCRDCSCMRSDSPFLRSRRRAHWW